MSSSPITSSFATQKKTLPTLQLLVATYTVEPLFNPQPVVDRAPGATVDHWAADDQDSDPFKAWRFFHGDIAEAWMDRFFQTEPDMYELADYASKLGQDDLTERNLKELLKDKQDIYVAIRERDRRSGYLSGGLYATTPSQSHPLDTFYYRDGTKFKPAFPHHTPLPAPPEDFYELMAYYLLGTSFCWSDLHLQDFGRLEQVRRALYAHRYKTLCKQLLPKIKKIWHKHEQYCGCCQDELRNFLDDRRRSQKTYTPLCKADLAEVLYGFNCPAHGPHQRCFHIVKPEFPMAWKPIPRGHNDYYAFYGTPCPGPCGPKPIIWDNRTPDTRNTPMDRVGSSSSQYSQSIPTICYGSSKKRGRSTSDPPDDTTMGVNNKRQRRELLEEPSTVESRTNSQEGWNGQTGVLCFPDTAKLAAIRKHKREEDMCPHKKVILQKYSHLPPDDICWRALNIDNFDCDCEYHGKAWFKKTSSEYRGYWKTDYRREEPGSPSFIYERRCLVLPNRRPRKKPRYIDAYGYC